MSNLTIKDIYESVLTVINNKFILLNPNDAENIEKLQKIKEYIQIKLQNLDKK